ncbi:MAG: MoaD/ThiS family protein [Acidobacteriota bacterium]
MSEPVAIEIFLPSLLVPAAGGKSSVIVEAATVQGCLDALIAAHPGVGPHLFDDAGVLRQHVNVFWNERSTRWLDSLEQPVQPGDTITVLQAVSGG